jgi:hypothetical protein
MTNLSPDVRCSSCDEVFTAEEELTRHAEAAHPSDIEQTHEGDGRGAGRTDVEGAGTRAEEPEPQAAEVTSGTEIARS